MLADRRSASPGPAVPARGDDPPEPPEAAARPVRGDDLGTLAIWLGRGAIRCASANPGSEQVTQAHHAKHLAALDDRGGGTRSAA